MAGFYASTNKKFMEDNPNIQPNPHVLKTLRDMSGMNNKWFGGKPLEITPQDEKEDISRPNSDDGKNI